MAKLPLPPDVLAAVGIRPSEYRAVRTSQLLWRVHRVAGARVTPWNELRHYGPVDARFEPHPPPPQTHADRAVWYAAFSPRTAVAEVWQRTRRVRLSSDHHLSSAKLTRPVRLLDITGDARRGSWATRAGASMALSTGRHDYTSAWARAICAAFPDLDGLVYRAAMEGGLAVALFLPAADAMPTTAVTSRGFGDPALAGRLAGLCDEIGYRVFR